MSRPAKWVVTILGSILALFVVGAIGMYIYVPDIHKQWVKAGIAQDEIPVGVNSTLAFVNTTVIPMDSQRVLEGQSVLVQNGRITEIGPFAAVEIPPDAHVVNGEGRFLIPGLSDMHMHTFGSENDLLVYLANGVTTVRILGGDPPAVLDWRDQIRAGTRIGPDMWVWWPQIESNDFDWAWGAQFATRRGEAFVNTPAEAERLIAEAAAMGVDGIKAHRVISSEVYLAILEAAATHGLPVDAHVPQDHYSRNLETERVCDGVDCWNQFRAMGTVAVSHIEELIKVLEWSEGSIRRATEESIQQVAQDFTDDALWVTTTLHLFRTVVDQGSDLEAALAQLPDARFVHPEVFDTRWGLGANEYVSLGSRDWYPDYLDAMERMLLALHESGALLMSGTDATLPLMAPGFSLHDELETMADVGLPPYDVLRTSTYNPALYLGQLEEFGTVEEGKRANLVLLEANPLDDISNTRLISGVMAQGNYYSRTELDLILDAVAENYGAAASRQSVREIVFPIIVVLLLASGWFFLTRTRRRRANG